MSISAPSTAGPAGLWGEAPRDTFAFMTDSTDLDGRVAHLEEMMAEKLGQKRGGLLQRSRRAGRMLPRRLRRDAEAIGQAQAMAAHPKLRRRIDAAAVSGADERLRAHLKEIDPADRRKGVWLGILAGFGFNMLVLGSIILAVLLWRDLI